MNRTTTWTYCFLAVAVIANECTAGACSYCGLSSTVPCDCSALLAGFESGFNDSPSFYQTIGSGWTTTSNGAAPFGEPAILTWSIVPDGTSLPHSAGEASSPSSLIEFLDAIHHQGPGPGGNDLTQRAWFPLIQSAFDRWDEVSGIQFTYEPNDDGVALGGLSGRLGVRGDFRIGGHSIDGTTSPTVVAYNYFPNNSDTVIDTDEVGRLGNSGGNYVRLRNTLMHETGHGLGLLHPDSSNARFLMEPFLDASIDGPQFDDILGIQRFYGDRYEENGGNDQPTRATDLGTVHWGHSVRIGIDATDTRVEPTQADFVSINKIADLDFYQFTIDRPLTLNILLTPMGPTYREGPQGGTQVDFNAAAQNDLALLLYDSTGTNVLASANSGGLGETEALQQFYFSTVGNYLLRISGTVDKAQFYELDISVVPEPPTLALPLTALVGVGLRRKAINRAA